MHDTRKIALLGTGLMGAPMGHNLLRAGHGLTVWNRTASKTASLRDAGATAAATPAKAISEAEVIITMLSDGFATQALLDDPAFQDALARGMIWIDMSSAKPAHARDQAAQLATRGVHHLDAPVSGGTKGAQAGTLAIMAGGSADVFDQVEPLLRALGRPVRVGPSGAGQLCKLANQAIVAVTISAVAEATLLVEKGGCDPAAMRAALVGGFADSLILQQHGQRMSEGNFAPGGPSKLQVKDLDNTLEEARALDLQLPSTQAVRERFHHFITELDGADLDHAGLFLELKARNNLA